MAATHATFAAWSGLPEEIYYRLAEWALHGYEVDGETLALAIVSGSEIHFAAAPRARHRVIQRDRIAEFLRPIFNRYGFLTTRVMHDRPDAARFVERLGFRQTRVGQDWTHYMLCDLPFARDRKEA